MPYKLPQNCCCYCGSVAKSCPTLCEPWTIARQASLSFAISWSLLKFKSIVSMMPSNHLILCHPLSPPALSLSQHQSPLESKEIKLVNPKGNQPWIFFERTDVEAEDPILWPPDVKSQLTGKETDAGKDWGQEENGVTKDEVVGCIIDSMDMSLQTPGDSEGQGSLACCSPQGCRVWRDWATEQQQLFASSPSKAGSN